MSAVNCGAHLKIQWYGAQMRLLQHCGTDMLKKRHFVILRKCQGSQGFELVLNIISKYKDVAISMSYSAIANKLSLLYGDAIVKMVPMGRTNVIVADICKAVVENWLIPGNDDMPVQIDLAYSRLTPGNSTCMGCCPVKH